VLGGDAGSGSSIDFSSAAPLLAGLGDGWGLSDVVDSAPAAAPGGEVEEGAGAKGGKGDKGRRAEPVEEGDARVRAAGLGGIVSEELLDRTEYDSQTSRAALSLANSLPSGALKKLEREQSFVRKDAEEQRVKRRQRGSPYKTHKKLRIISGDAAGKFILSPSDERTRPMMEKVRAATFSMLLSEIGSGDGYFDEGTRWIDFYAGTGEPCPGGDPRRPDPSQCREPRARPHDADQRGSFLPTPLPALPQAPSAWRPCRGAWTSATSSSSTRSSPTRSSGPTSTSAPPRARASSTSPAPRTSSSAPRSPRPSLAVRPPPPNRAPRPWHRRGTPRDAATHTPPSPAGPFDFISACPPYEKVSYPEMFELLARSPLVHEGSYILVEYPLKEQRAVPETLGPLVKIRDRRYGRTFLAIWGPAEGALA